MGSSLSWKLSHSINTLSINQANLFQMNGEIFMNFTPKTSIRCNQSKLSPNLTVEDTEKHPVRRSSFTDFVGIETETLDLQ